MAHPPAFALVHGGGQGSWVWADVVLLDVPGCGRKRGRDTIALTPDDVADDLLADMAAAGPGPWIVVRHSQGGTMLPILWRRAAAGRIARLVHLACCAPAPGQSVLDMMGRGLHGAHPDEVGWPRDPAKHDRETMRRITMGNDMDEAQFAAFVAQDGLDAWPMPVTLWVDWRYDDPAPATYIVCERDGILPVAWRRRFADRLGVTRIATIDAGHQAMMTNVTALAALLPAEAA